MPAKTSARHLFSHSGFSAFFLGTEIAPMLILRTVRLAADHRGITEHQVIEIPDERAAWAAAEAACEQWERDNPTRTVFQIPLRQPRADEAAQ